VNSEKKKRLGGLNFILEPELVYFNRDGCDGNLEIKRNGEADLSFCFMVMMMDTPNG
jgi:hypothetical protein